MSTGTESRTLALTSLLKREGRRGEKLATRHPAPPDLDVPTGPLDVMLRGEVTLQQRLLRETLRDAPCTAVDSGISFYAARRELTAWKRWIALAERTPSVICRLASCREEALHRALLGPGLRAIACVTLRVAVAQRISFLAPLGTALARRVVDLLAAEAASSLRNSRPAWMVEWLTRVSKSLWKNDLRRSNLIFAMSATLLQVAVNSLDTECLSLLHELADPSFRKFLERAIEVDVPEEGEASLVVEMLTPEGWSGAP